MRHEKNATVFLAEKKGYGPRDRGEVLTRGGSSRDRVYQVAWDNGSVTTVKEKELLPMAPDRQPFVWGDIIATHRVGPYAIVEFTRNRPGNAKDDWEPHTSFHYYVDGADTNHSCGSLDAALVACVAFRQEGLHRGSSAALNSRAAGYFMRMVGPNCDPGAEK